jgi:hypothetical protein
MTEREEEGEGLREEMWWNALVSLAVQISSFELHAVSLIPMECVTSGEGSAMPIYAIMSKTGFKVM